MQNYDNNIDKNDKIIDNSNNLNIQEQNKWIKIIMNQTTYTYEESKNKLELYNNNYIDVIKNYNGISIKKNDDDKNIINNLNQTIYREIRNFIKEVK